MKSRTFHSSISHQLASWVLKLLEHLRRALTKTVDFWTVFELPDRQTANSVTTPLSSEQIMTLVSLDRLPPSPSCWAARPTPSPAAPRPSVRLPPFINLSPFSGRRAPRSLARNHISPARPLPFLTLFPAIFGDPRVTADGLLDSRRCDCASVRHIGRAVSLLEHRGVGHLDVEHQVAEGTVDVLAAALQRRVVGRVEHVHRDGPRLLVVGRELRVQLEVPRPDDARVRPLRQHDRAGGPRRRRSRGLSTSSAMKILALNFCLRFGLKVVHVLILTCDTNLNVKTPTERPVIK